MRFIDEMSDWMYIDEYIQKAELGKETSAEIYLKNLNEKVTIEFEITDLVRANNLINILKYDHDGNISKTLGVKMTKYDIAPRERATKLYGDLSPEEKRRLYREDDGNWTFENDYLDGKYNGEMGV